eukprot:2144961-Rhodomonas_salina.4
MAYLSYHVPILVQLIDPPETIRYVNTGHRIARAQADSATHMQQAELTKGVQGRLGSIVAGSRFSPLSPGTATPGVRTTTDKHKSWQTKLTKMRNVEKLTKMRKKLTKMRKN